MTIRTLVGRVRLSQEENAGVSPLDRIEKPELLIAGAIIPFGSRPAP